MESDFFFPPHSMDVAKAWPPALTVHGSLGSHGKGITWEEAVDIGGHSLYMTLRAKLELSRAAPFPSVQRLVRLFLAPVSLLLQVRSSSSGLPGVGLLPSQLGLAHATSTPHPVATAGDFPDPTMASP